MTYNFDPERWHDDQLRLVAFRREAGEIDEETAKRLVEDIDRRYEVMLDRLDRTYQMPK